MLAHSQVRALRESLRLLQENNAWPENSDIQDELSLLIHGLFETVAWSDRSLHLGEIRLLDVLLEQDRALGGSLEEHIARSAEVQNFTRAIPKSVQHSVELDRQSGTRLATILINNLENLGRAIMLSDGHVTAQESEALDDYIRTLRGYAFEKVLATPIDP